MSLGPGPRADIDGSPAGRRQYKCPPRVVSTMASDGDIRVLVVLDLLLSAAFATAVVWGLDFVGVAEFTLPNVAIATAALAVLTYVVVLRG